MASRAQCQYIQQVTFSAICVHTPVYKRHRPICIVCRQTQTDSLVSSTVFRTCLLERKVRNVALVGAVVLRRTFRNCSWRTCLLTVFLYALGFLVAFARPSGYTFWPDKITNSLGCTDPVSLFNFPSTRWFVLVY